MTFADGAMASQPFGAVPGKILTLDPAQLDAAGNVTGLFVGASVSALSSGVLIAGFVGVTEYGALVAAVGSGLVVGGYIASPIFIQTEQSKTYDVVNIAIRDAFGIDVRYVQNGNAYSLTAVFTDEAETIIGPNEVISTAPMLTVRRADMPNNAIPLRNDMLAVDGKTYTVWEVRKDDSDAYLLMLKAR